MRPVTPPKRGWDLSNALVLKVVVPAFPTTNRRKPGVEIKSESSEKGRA